VQMLRTLLHKYVLLLVTNFEGNCLNLNSILLFLEVQYPFVGSTI
jgi:hypothetical protein